MGGLYVILWSYPLSVRTFFLHKIFKRHTLKLNYSCMPNVKSVISSHNKYILSNFNSQTKQPDTCNCRKKPDCPLEGKCLQSNVIFQATVTTARTTETYVGLATNFKERCFPWNWLAQMTSTNPIISSQALIVIRSKEIHL